MEVFSARSVRRAHAGPWLSTARLSAFWRASPPMCGEPFSRAWREALAIVAGARTAVMRRATKVGVWIAKRTILAGSKPWL